MSTPQSPYGNQGAPQSPYGNAQPPYGNQGGPQPHWNQGGPPPTYGSPPPPPGPRKGAKALSVIGSVLILVSIGCAVALGVQIYKMVNGFSSNIPVEGRTEVTLAQDEWLVLYLPAGSPVGCTVEGPTEAVPDTTLLTSMTLGLNGITYNGIGKVGGEGEPSGTYAVECDGAGAILAPPVSIGGIGLLVISGVVGVFSLVIGIILVVVGGVLRGRRRA